MMIIIGFTNIILLQVRLLSAIIPLLLLVIMKVQENNSFKLEAAKCWDTKPTLLYNIKGIFTLTLSSFLWTNGKYFFLMFVKEMIKCLKNSRNLTVIPCQLFYSHRNCIYENDSLFPVTNHAIGEGKTTQAPSSSKYLPPPPWRKLRRNPSWAPSRPVAF